MVARSRAACVKLSGRRGRRIGASLHSFVSRKIECIDYIIWFIFSGHVCKQQEISRFYSKIISNKCYSHISMFDLERLNISYRAFKSENSPIVCAGIYRSYTDSFVFILNKLASENPQSSHLIAGVNYYANLTLESFFSGRDHATMLQVSKKPQLNTANFIHTANNFMKQLEAKSRGERKKYKRNSLFATLSMIVKNSSQIDVQEIISMHGNNREDFNTAHAFKILLDARSRDRTPKQHSVIQRLKNQVRDFPC